MKKAWLLLSIFLLGFLASCHRSSCPTYDSNTGEMKIRDSKRTKSGLFPP